MAEREYTVSLTDCLKREPTPDLAYSYYKVTMAKRGPEAIAKHIGIDPESMLDNLHPVVILDTLHERAKTMDQSSVSYVQNYILETAGLNNKDVPPEEFKAAVRVLYALNKRSIFLATRESY